MHLRLEDVEEALLANSIIIPRTPKLYTHTHIHTYIHTQLASQSFNLSLSVCLFTHIHILLLPSSFLPLPAHASHYISHITACSPLSSPHTHTLSLNMLSLRQRMLFLFSSLSLSYTHTHSLSLFINFSLSRCEFVFRRGRQRESEESPLLCFGVEVKASEGDGGDEWGGDGGCWRGDGGGDGDVFIEW